MVGAPATKDSELPPDIRKMSFEQALSSLEEIVQKLEAGDVSLEDSIAIYVRGTQLRRYCEEKLRAAHEKIDKIVPGADGNVGTEAVEIE
ncbi:MAG: exodeoxyribonuclease VII small subunit [Alphaproteobacteria bacterium]|nr:exodeoxyribonuclease VII small subunit [Alphaproteobacteria bacterium]